MESHALPVLLKLLPLLLLQTYTRVLLNDHHLEVLHLLLAFYLIQRSPQLLYLLFSLFGVNTFVKIVSFFTWSARTLDLFSKSGFSTKTMVPFDFDLLFLLVMLSGRIGLILSFSVLVIFLFGLEGVSVIKRRWGSIGCSFEFSFVDPLFELFFVIIDQSFHLAFVAFFFSKVLVVKIIQVLSTACFCFIGKSHLHLLTFLLQCEIVN